MSVCARLFMLRSVARKTLSAVFYVKINFPSARSKRIVMNILKLEPWSAIVFGIWMVVCYEPCGVVLSQKGNYSSRISNLWAKGRKNSCDDDGLMWMRCCNLCAILVKCIIISYFSL